MFFTLILFSEILPNNTKSGRLGVVLFSMNSCLWITLAAIGSVTFPPGRSICQHLLGWWVDRGDTHRVDRLFTECGWSDCDAGLGSFEHHTHCAAQPQWQAIGGSLFRKTGINSRWKRATILVGFGFEDLSNLVRIGCSSDSRAVSVAVTQPGASGVFWNCSSEDALGGGSEVEMMAWVLA